MKRYLLTILLSLWCVCAWAAGSVTVRGRVLCGGRGVEGVWVSDGEEFARTDKRGNYSLEAGADNRFVFVCVPAGYDAPVKKGVVRYFHPLPAEGKSCDFTLLRRAGDDSRYGFIAIADPQIWAPKEFAKLAAAADDIAATVRSYGGMPFHGICCGDIVSHDHSLYGRYNEVMERTGITFRNAMGNHDMKLWGRSHETSAAAFEAMYGPAYYSYNVGEVHYAVLNDNYYIGRDWYYIGYLEERQLAWLERDLSFVPAGTTVVVALHIPTAFAGKDEKPFDYPQAERSLCNHRALHRLLEPYDAHVVSGHMHTTTNCPVREGLYEHNVAALSGAWWQGAICTDGTPAGYAVFEVDGGEVTWYYKSVGHPRSFQLKIYDSKDDEAFAGRVVANVWNCDPAWTVEMHADGGRPVRMERTTAVDPQARRLYADASKLDHKWITVTPSDHYYAAPLPAGTRRVEVTARDRFGNTYRAEKRINR